MEGKWGQIATAVRFSIQNVGNGHFERFAPAVNEGGLIYFKLKDDDDHKVMALNYDGEEVCGKFSVPKPLLDDECTGYYPHNPTCGV